MELRETTKEWLAAAVAGIHFEPDKLEVKVELQAHIEDKTADFQRIFPDMSREEAEERALAEMGDPEEIGRELAKVHKPWLGYLWMASKVLLGVLAVLFLLSNIVGIRVWGGENPYQTNYTAPVGLEPERVTLGGYTFEVKELVYMDYPEDQRTYEDALQVTVRVSSPRFWERAGNDLYRYMTLVYPDGSRHEAKGIVEGAESRISSQVVRWGVFWQEFTTYVWEPCREGDRVRLEFDFPVGSFELSAQVTEQVVE